MAGLRDLIRPAGVEIKDADQLAAMRRAGLVVARTLTMLRELARPGLTTSELDAAAERHIRQLGAEPSFLGYQGFDGSICVSVNDEVVHGVPGARRLTAGDLLSIDCGAVLDGWHGDAAVTFGVGGAEDLREDAAALSRVTEEAMWRGVAAVRAGGRLRDVSAAVETSVRGAVGPPDGYGIVVDYTGHGIGSALHQPPDVPNVADRGRGLRLVPGLALAVEPMLTLGRPETDVLDDEWTTITRDGSWAAHHEHTVAVTDSGTWVLTALDGGRERLAALGVSYGGD